MWIRYTSVTPRTGGMLHLTYFTDSQSHNRETFTIFLFIRDERVRRYIFQSFLTKHTILLIMMFRVFGKYWIRNPESENGNGNGNGTGTETRQKNWKCYEGVTDNNCSRKTFRLHVSYYRFLIVRNKTFLREFYIRVNVATWVRDHSEIAKRRWMIHGALSRKGATYGHKSFHCFQLYWVWKGLPIVQNILICFCL